MGTNYYMENNRCGKVNVGKSSAGWHFGLNIYPELGIYGLNDWKNEFVKVGTIIVDENYKIISPEDMIDIITNRHGSGNWSKDELEKNHAEAGLNGLAAHKSCIIDFRKDPIFAEFEPLLCVWFRTDGTYDLAPRSLAERLESY